MKLQEALTKLSDGGRFIRDELGFQIVRKPDSHGNHHHKRITARLAESLIKRGHSPESRFAH